MRYDHSVRNEWIVSEKLHTEPRGALRNGLSDFAEGYDAHRAPPQTMDGLPCLPSPDALVRRPVVADDLPRKRQPERDRVVRHLLRAVVPDIGDLDALR